MTTAAQLVQGFWFQISNRPGEFQKRARFSIQIWKWIQFWIQILTLWPLSFDLFEIQRPIMLLMGNQPTCWSAFTSRLSLYRIPSEVYVSHALWVNLPVNGTRQVGWFPIKNIIGLSKQFSGTPFSKKHIFWTHILNRWDHGFWLGLTRRSV